jgi:hypothetical protein
MKKVIIAYVAIVLLAIIATGVMSYGFGYHRGIAERTFREATTDVQDYWKQEGELEAQVESWKTQAEANKSLTYKDGYNLGYKTASADLTAMLQQTQRKQGGYVLVNGSLNIKDIYNMPSNLIVYTINTPTAVTISGGSTIMLGGNWKFYDINTAIAFESDDSR